MQKNIIINSIKQDQRRIITIGSVLSSICIIIILLHWNYLFNCLKGPFPLTKDLIETKSNKKYFIVDLPLMEIGSEKMGFQHSAQDTNGFTTAKFLLTNLEGKFLVVRVNPDYKSGPVKGFLSPLPEQIKDTVSSDSDTYSSMLDCNIGYILDTDLFMILAVITLPVSLLILIFSFYLKKNLSSHKAISSLRAFGAPLTIVDKIESELEALPHNQIDSSLYYSDSWVLFLKPALKILSAHDLIGFGTEKEKNGITKLVLWVRGKQNNDTLIMSKTSLNDVLERLKTAFPYKYKENSREFKKQWRVKRSEFERE